MTLLPPARQFAGPSDLARMQAALSAAWRARRPLVPTGVGDLEWWLVLGGPDADWSARVRLWPGEDDAAGGPVRAYAWWNPPDDVDLHQRWDLPAAQRAALLDEGLAWVVASILDHARAGDVAPPATLTTWALDSDDGLHALLEERGFTPDPSPTFTHWHRTLDGLEPVPPVPAGYHVRHVGWPQDIQDRVEVHRAAFALSRMTVERYTLLARQRHYHPDRDLVVVAPGGTFAAFANAWFDPEALQGELEPVGTHPDHRRRGLALVVVLAALHALRAAGALDCVVLSRTTNAASEALYARAGFVPVSSHRAWRRPLR